MQQNPDIRVGVIGTGVMGGYHTRVAAMLPGCALIGIHDADPARADDMARQYGVAAFRSCDELCAATEAVIVATPTATHADVAAACLRAGCHVLVEKPLAATPAEAEALVALEREAQRILMVGHVERFNPAITVLLSVIDPREVVACEATRLSTTLGRDQSVDIIFDLMIHDLDLMLACTPDTTVSLVAATGHCLRGDLVDYATAMLRSATGATFTLTASAISQERMRKLRILTREVQFTVDCATREVWVQRHGKSSYVPYAAGHIEQITVPTKDPLALEQEHFLQAIRTGTPPKTGAVIGLRSVQLAGDIQTCIREQLVMKSE